MPVYEYICRKCKKKTEIETTISQKEKGLDVKCPSCGAGDMERVFTPLMVSSPVKEGGKPLSCGMKNPCPHCDQK